MTDYLKKLEYANIRSWDLKVGDSVYHYLDSQISKKDLKKKLIESKKTHQFITKKIEKLLEILSNCPSNCVLEEQLTDGPPSEYGVK